MSTSTICFIQNTLILVVITLLDLYRYSKVFDYLSAKPNPHYTTIAWCHIKTILVTFMTVIKLITSYIVVNIAIDLFNTAKNGGNLKFDSKLIPTISKKLFVNLTPYIVVTTVVGLVAAISYLVLSYFNQDSVSLVKGLFHFTWEPYVRVIINIGMIFYMSILMNSPGVPCIHDM
jgi:hypothetical protein